MLRLGACAALVFAMATFVPLERPAVQAENWQAGGNGNSCIDRDSFGHDGKLAIMLVDNDCSSDPQHGNAFLIEGDCSQKATADGYILYAVDRRTHARVQTRAKAGGNVITTLCAVDRLVP